MTLAIILDFHIWSQDVTQSYIQGHDLTRDVYVRPAKEFGLPSNVLLKLEKPLYGLSESGDSWYCRYSTFLKDKMKVTPTDADPSFYFKSIYDKIIGLLGVYVDDTLAEGNKEFEKETDKIPAEFDSKPREFPPILFAGMNIERNSTGGYKLYQKTVLGQNRYFIKGRHVRRIQKHQT